MSVLGTLALLSGASVGIAQGASAHSLRSTPHWGDFRALPAGQPQSDPAHWVSTLGPHVSGTKETAESTNWSGYVDTGPTFTAVSGQWVVPAVQASQSSESSGTWIGIDGATNSSLIQTGTAQQTSGGATIYYAWYEILPANAIIIGGVSPGDDMSASVVRDSPGRGRSPSRISPPG